jgi:hypothetical protein
MAELELINPETGEAFWVDESELDTPIPSTPRPSTSEEIQVPRQIDEREPLISKELALFAMILVVGAYLATWFIALFVGLTLHHTKKVLEWCGYKKELPQDRQGG